MRPVRFAMVGGGPQSFIGPIHKMAAELDGHAELVAGAFSRDGARSAEAGRRWGLDPDRVHADFRTLVAAESARPDGAEFVIVVTPNHLHFAVSSAAMQAGLHVMSDKPATRTLEEAVVLSQVVQDTRRLYGLTFVYAGYPMVREAREIIGRGDLGAVRKIVVEYAQGWLSTPLEQTGDKQASWRADPALSGVGGAIADIGVHAFHLAEFIGGRPVTDICAELTRFVPGRVLDDDCNVLLRLEGGARGVLIASQVSAGARNGLRISVYGEKGGLSWSHERSAELVIDRLDGPSLTLHAASPYLSPAALGASRLPPGHPEGFIEAFATLYRDFVVAIVEARSEAPVPGIREGLRSMAFVERAVAASREGAGWVSLEGLKS